MKLIDSHTHLFLDEFADDLPEVMARARAEGLTHLFMPNIDSTTVEPLLRVCTAYPGFCHPMAGLHPTSVGPGYEEELACVRRELDSGRSYVAVGEIGMDLYWDSTYLKEQQLVFARQVEWALEASLPIVIHCRKAFPYIYSILAPYRDTSLAGIFHSFTGDAAEAAQMMEFSRFMIGINGVVTFKKSELPHVLPDVPLERIVLETDAPYLAPVPCRGRRNESAYLSHTLRKVADVYGRTAEEVAEITSKNALKVFGMLK